MPITLYIVRLIFAGLILFESANYFKILSFDLDYSWIGLILTAIAVWLGIELVQYFFKKNIGRNLPAVVLIVPTASIVLDAFGDFFMLYSEYCWYDQVAHFTGGTSAALVLYFVIKTYFSHKEFDVSKKSIGIFTIFGTSFFASLYEIEEYAETILLKNNRLGDRLDTPNDLFLTILGGGLGALVIMIYLRIKKR